MARGVRATLKQRVAGRRNLRKAHLYNIGRHRRLPRISRGGQGR